MMIGIAANVLMVGFWWWLGSRLTVWRWSACTCGRSKMPYFVERHEKEWLMVGFIGILAGFAVASALVQDTFISILAGLLAVWQGKVVTEHRKGRKRKSVLRALGHVVVTRHGTLSVQP